jgi:hypothetical protein
VASGIAGSRSEPIAENAGISFDFLPNHPVNDNTIPSGNQAFAIAVVPQPWL